MPIESLPSAPQSATKFRLLVPVRANSGLAAHIPDAAGHALCNTYLKLSLWRIENTGDAKRVICQHCRKKQEQSRQTE
jgi:hypothetical protein